MNVTLDAVCAGAFAVAEAPTGMDVTCANCMKAVGTFPVATPVTELSAFFFQVTDRFVIPDVAAFAFKTRLACDVLDVATRVAASRDCWSAIRLRLARL